MIVAHHEAAQSLVLLLASGGVVAMVVAIAGARWRASGKTEEEPEKALTG